MNDTARQNSTLPKGTRLQSPQQVYVIEEVLGSGGFGVTYKASANVRVGNVYGKFNFALKEFFMKDSCERDASHSVCYSNPVKDKVEDSRRDFMAEARRLIKLGTGHPNIVHVNEVFEANNTAYYVMEYLDKGSLRSLVKREGPMTERKMLSYMLPVMDAVCHLHADKLNHLDIKPDNIMLRHDDESGRDVPVLIDFGLAKHYDSDGNPTSTLRTAGASDGYSPVEQYAGIKSFSPQADVYALGATMLYLLTGHDPAIAFDLDDSSVRLQLPAAVSPRVTEVIVKAMNSRRQDRYSSVAEMRTLLGGMPPVVVKEPETPVVPERNQTVKKEPKKAQYKKVKIPLETVKQNNHTALKVVLGVAVGLMTLFVLAFVAIIAFADDDDPFMSKETENLVTPDNEITDFSSWYEYTDAAKSCSVTVPGKYDENELQECQVLNLTRYDSDPGVVVCKETKESLASLEVNSEESYADAVISACTSLESTDNYEALRRQNYNDNGFLVVYDMDVDGETFRYYLLAHDAGDSYYYCMVFCLKSQFTGCKDKMLAMLDKFKVYD